MSASNAMSGPWQIEQRSTAQRSQVRSRRLMEFLKLDPTIRNRIYAACIGSHIHPELRRIARLNRNDTISECVRYEALSIGRGWKEGWQAPISYGHYNGELNFLPLEAHAIPTSPLMLTCKQVYQEYLIYAYTHTVKSFSNVRSFVETRPLIAVQCLNRVQLNLSMEQYAVFFGMNLPGLDYVPDANKTEPPAAGLARSSMPCLAHLEIRFPTPLFLPYSDPWFHRLSGSVDYKFHAIPSSCQNAMTICIMYFAYAYICHIPEVVLTGYIKNRTREKWGRILGGYQTHQPAARVVQLLQTAKAENLPPKCECRVKCGEREMEIAKAKEEGRLDDWKRLLKEWRFDWEV